MAVKLITGLKSEADIESQDDGARIYGTISNGDRVLNVGSKWAYQTISNNCIRIKDGEALMQGRHVRQAPSTYTDLTINNGTQGKKRYDIIVLRYTKALGTGIENVELAVVEGTPGTSATMPTLTTGDIFTGCTTHEMALYRVYIDGLNISSVARSYTLINSMEDFATTNQIIYYVSPSGSDTNSGTSYNSPFGTINYALSKIPKCLRHDVTIRLLEGTYSEYLNISGYYGNGTMKITGYTGESYSTNSSYYKINSLMKMEYNSCPIHLRGIQANNGISIHECSRRVTLDYNIIYPNTDSTKGVDVFSSNSVSVEQSKFVNCPYAVSVWVDGYCYVNANDYVNCSVFYQCNSGILLAGAVNSGSPTSAKSQYGWGGLIVNQSGATIGS